uniref:Transposase (Putative), gypsy type n=1 Tax=Tanacetum cinerariifolium TaxID=118510 RepID=A0A6L2MGM7_TANCI|nr:transposase (putative), gypsy type [Tanacetum cinerariifolium]
MDSIDDMKSTLTQSALDALCEKFIFLILFTLNYLAVTIGSVIVSPLSVIAAAKVSHFEILCRVHGFISTVGNFRRFYIHSKNKGWMSFSKRSDTAQAEMVLFAFINHVDPTKVRIEEREVGEGEVPLLEFTRGCFVLLVGVMIKGVLIGEVPTTVAEKPKKMRKRKVVDGASGSALPPKRLREDHGTFGDAGSSTAEKSLAALLDSPCYSSSNAVDTKISSVTMFNVLDPPIQTTTIATTVAAAPSIPIPRVGTEPVRHSIFRDSVSPSTVEENITGPSQPIDAELFVEFNVRVARQACFSTLVRLRPEHNYEERKKFERRCARMIGLLREKDVEVANLKAQLFVKEAKAAEAIRLRSQDSKSCDELSIKAASLESEKNKFVNQVSTLKTTCSGLCDQVSGYELFKEQTETVQDEHVKVLSDRVAGLEFELIEMALHMDEEFYPRYLTTIAGRRWILGRDLKHAVMKSLQSSEYLAALGGAIGRVIDKGMQDGLAAGIDHRKAERGFVDIATYNPSVKANYVSAINTLYVVDFLFLTQLKSQKMQRIRGDAASRRLSLSDALVPLIEPLSNENLVASDHAVADMELHVGASSSLKIIFEQETLETSSEYPITWLSLLTLQGTKVNYLPMEKLVLALVHVARRLRRGRSLCIKYAPRSAIKGQVLADFLADTMAEDSSTQKRASGPNDTLTEGENREEKEALETITLEIERLKQTYGSYIPTEHLTNTDLGLKKASFVDSKLVANQELNERPVDMAKVNAIIEEATTTWMTPLYEYIEHGTLPEDAAEA